MSSEGVPGTNQTSTKSLAHRLGRAITDLPEYERYLETRKKVENSEEAQEKLAEFEQVRKKQMLAHQTGDSSQADVEELQTLQAELQAVPAMAEHREAKAHLKAQLAELDDIISDPLAVDFSQNAGSCCQE